jgi:urate oxidase
VRQHRRVALLYAEQDHFVVDLTPFGQDNPGEVLFAADRPYGLIEASVLREDASAAGCAWDGLAGFC